MRCAAKKDRLESNTATKSPSLRRRLRLAINGTVQGVGFRPFIYRLATELGLFGWVKNSPQGVSLEIEGEAEAVAHFRRRWVLEKPACARIYDSESTILAATGCTQFQILSSVTNGPTTTSILPDIATCPDCQHDIFDPTNRRYLYPFTNCTHCGPRFTIIHRLPYDRPNTSMRAFSMCPDCQREYEDPLDRRFHAQPNACQKCGPQLSLWNRDGRVVAKGANAILQTVAAIRAGKIVAAKGLGGFHLLTNTSDDAAVDRLRARKHREEKPFALMFPDVRLVRDYCEVSPCEAELLRSAASPIVILDRRNDCGRSVSAAIAPGNPCLGVMLPSTPLHHILLQQLSAPVIATSGNRSTDPTCIDNGEALEHLAGIADLWLVHDRPILRQADDSIVRVMAGREMVLRRARGYAPLPIQTKAALPPMLAVGAQLKNTVAISSGQRIILSPHIGDLESAETNARFSQAAADLQRVYDSPPEKIICDAHPDYPSTHFANQQTAPVISVQHHVAHVFSCLLDNQLDPPCLGIAWDGTGWGQDKALWGGEFFAVGESTIERVASFRPFMLPGGDRAAREPRRSALGLLYDLYAGDFSAAKNLPPLQAFSAAELATIKIMLRRKLNSFATSSTGRLFDAVAAILGIRQVCGFEGQAAMALEFALQNIDSDERYPITLIDKRENHGASVMQLDWRPMLRELLAEVRQGAAIANISARFHNTLVQGMMLVAQRVGETNVVLTGGCFQNRYLLTRSIRQLQAAGFRAFWHQRVPPNDGGISLGQLVSAAQYSSEEFTGA